MIKLFAGILMAIGILLMTGSGLCSLFVIFGSGPNVGPMIWFVLVLGACHLPLGSASLLGASSCSSASGKSRSTNWTSDSADRQQGALLYLTRPFPEPLSVC